MDKDDCFPRSESDGRHVRRKTLWGHRIGHRSRCLRCLFGSPRRAVLSARSNTSCIERAIGSHHIYTGIHREHHLESKCEASSVISSPTLFPCCGSAGLDRHSQFSRSPFSTPQGSHFRLTPALNHSPTLTLVPGVMVSGDRSWYTA